MNKNQLLQVYQDLYNRYGKISKKQANKLVYYLKQFEKINNELVKIEHSLTKQSHCINVKTKVRANNDYNNQLKTLKNQCGYTYDLFNFVTLNRQAKIDKPKQKTKIKKASKQVKTITKKASEKQKTFNQAFKDCIKLDTIRKASK